MKLYWRVKRDGKWTWIAAETERRYLPVEDIPGLEEDCIIVKELIIE